MTTFTDGPARGKTLYLRRAPLFLRVAIDPRGGVDALDRPDDAPRPGERLYAYRLASDGGYVHINSRTIGGSWRISEYSLVEPQPADGEMRTRAAWVAWAEAGYAAGRSPVGETPAPEPEG